ncbi:unnamed protein product [Adineta steineri]|uniref:CRAL-TRIO domain-containing protein n=1 Tax=Adineta steineri TaxID=433720 RepID=A0A815QEF4_9BILA|nr:unnamed protein product [Adineta steineri]
MAENADQLNNFRTWVQEQQPILNSLNTDEFLLRFLRVTNFNLNHAKEWLIYFWKHRTENPQWFFNRDLLKNPIMLEISELAYCIQLPKETKDNHLIFIMRIGQYDTTKYTFNDVTKYAFAVTDILNRQPSAQINGYIIILDFSNIKFQHVNQFTPDYTRRYVNCWEKMYPVKLHQVHFYNYPSLFDPILHLFRMFLNTKLNDKIYLHSKALEKSLHQYIDPDLLPQEYGGQLGSIEGNLNKTFVQYTREDNNYMIQFDQYGVDLDRVSNILKALKKENNN